MICHCRTCRRAAGAPVVAWVTFAAASFAFTQGEPGVVRSTPPVRRTYCRDCGTPLTYGHAGRPLEIDVTTCSLDEPDAYPPTYQAWLAHDLAWVRFGDELPAFPEWRTE
jgi:hypothetical protein